MLAAASTLRCIEPNLSPPLSIESAACQAKLVPLFAGVRGLGCACRAGGDVDLESSRARQGDAAGARAPRLIRPRGSSRSGLMLALLAWSCLAAAEGSAVQRFAQVASPIHADAAPVSPPIARAAERGRPATRSVTGNSLHDPRLVDGSRGPDQIWLTQGSRVETLAFDLPTPVASEWRTAAPTFGFEPDSVRIGLGSGYRLSLRVRHGGPMLWLQRKF